MNIKNNKLTKRKIKKINKNSKNKVEKRPIIINSNRETNISSSPKSLSYLEPTL